jgi:hypothetical protein
LEKRRSEERKMWRTKRDIRKEKILGKEIREFGKWSNEDGKGRPEERKMKGVWKKDEKGKTRWRGRGVAGKGKGNRRCKKMERKEMNGGWEDRKREGIYQIIGGSGRKSDRRVREVGVRRKKKIRRGKVGEGKDQ